MFSFLDMINSSLSYFNLDVKLKNRIYIVLATLGDIYLVYVTFRLFVNQAWLRGFLYCLAMIAITYFIYVNFVFYFLGKTSQFDFLSPRIAKITGQKFADNSQSQMRRRTASQQGLLTSQMVFLMERIRSPQLLRLIIQNKKISKKWLICF